MPASPGNGGGGGAPGGRGAPGGGGGGGGGGGTLYDLLAVSCHSGSLWGGHYYAHARHPESGRWHTFNDSGVTGFDPASLEGGSNAAYVLFYGRRRGE